MEAVIIIFVLAWLLSPIFLLIITIVQRNQNKSYKGELEYQKTLLYNERIKSAALYKENEKLKAAQKGDVASCPSDEQDEKQEEAMQPTPEQTEPIFEQPQPIFEQQLPEQSMPVQSQPVYASNNFAMPGPASMSDIGRTPDSAVMQADRNTDAFKTMTQPTPMPQPMSQSMSMPQPMPMPQTMSMANAPERKQLSVGVILFGIGTLLVLLAGAIFATSSWKFLPAAGKVAVLLGAVAVFYAGAFVASKKLKLRNTSITFYILGSTFLAVTNLAAGYFEWYGLRWNDSDNQLLIWSLSVLITAACLIVGSILYSTAILEIIGYCSLMLGTLMMSIYATDNLFVIMSIMGIMLLLSRMYVCLTEYRTGKRVIALFLDIMSFVFGAVALVVLIGYRMSVGVFDKADAVDKFMAVLVALINLGVNVWPAILAVRNKPEGQATGLKTVKTIFGAVSIVSIGFADRISEQFSTRIVISLLITVAIYVAVTLLRRKGREDVCVRWVAEATTGIMLFVAFCTEIASGSMGIQIVVIAAAIITYMMQYLNKNTAFAFSAAVAFETGLIRIFMLTGVAEADILAQCLIFAVIVVLMVVGRLLYGKLVSRSEQGIMIDWISIATSLLWIYNMINAGEYCSDNVSFVTVLVSAAFFAGFVGRINGVADRIFLTIASCWVALVGSIQPVFEVNEDFIIEWFIAFIMLATGLSAIVWRKYKRAYIFVWMAAIGLSFMMMFINLMDMGYPLLPETFKLVTCMIAMIVLLVVAYLKKSKVLLVETGVVMTIYALLIWNVAAQGLFIIMALLGIAYLIYLHYAEMSVWSFLPVAQIFIILGGFEIGTVGWLLTFIVVMIAGYTLHRVWDSGNSFSDDWINISGIFPVMAVMTDGSSKWLFCGEMMIIVYIFSFYRRYIEDKNALSNKILLSVATAFATLAWITQPWFEVPRLLEAEWVIIGLIGFGVINAKLIYKHTTVELWGWITYAIAIMCVIFQAVDAIGTGEVVDALILGTAMLIVIIWAFALKKKQWFLLAAVALVAQSIYASRRFWLSIAWWVYLLAAGAILIAIAARSEYRKRTGAGDGKGKKQLFRDWTL